MPAATKTAPRVFISYSWDDEKHKEWVLRLADCLVADGVDVILDEYEMHAGKNLFHFADNAIAVADKIIAVFTPVYRRKAEDRDAVAGYEYSIIHAGVFKNIARQEKLIPLLRTGSIDDSIPVFLQQFIHLDFTKDGAFERQYEKLLRVIFNRPKNPRGAIGDEPVLPVRPAGIDRRLPVPVPEVKKRKPGTILIPVAAGLCIAAVVAYKVWPLGNNSAGAVAPAETHLAGRDSARIDGNNARQMPGPGTSAPSGSGRLKIGGAGETTPVKEPPKLTVKYDYTYAIAQGRRRVMLNGKYGFTDIKGYDISGMPDVELKYEDAADFSEGLALVRQNNLYGFIDLQGKKAIACTYDFAESFNDGKAKVKAGGEYFYIDKSGARIADN